MRKTISTLMLFFLLPGLKAQEVRLYGQVTDFQGVPIEGASIRLKNKLFENLYETLSGKDGKFSMQVRKDNYYCLYVIKLADYKKTKLEYWAWNVPVFNDLEINPQYDNMEIYGLNVFEPQVTPQETFRLYFRPMSLIKGQGITRVAKGDTLNIAPDKITPDELTVKINGINADIVGINKVSEYARGNYLYGYDIQVLKPTHKADLNSKSESVTGYDKISIILQSKETNETGKAEAFVKQVE